MELRPPLAVRRSKPQSWLIRRWLSNSWMRVLLIIGNKSPYSSLFGLAACSKRTLNLPNCSGG